MSDAAAIRRARGDEVPLLREIQLASKAYWGYSEETMSRFAEVISMSSEYFGTHEVWVIAAHRSVRGWYSLLLRDDVCELHNMWVLPTDIGRGLGRQLYEHARARAEASGASRFEWEAEPNAAGFYAHMGGKHLRTATSLLDQPIAWMGVELRSHRFPR
jgi:GNAT superfamily N-acetyltransferase